MTQKYGSERIRRGLLHFVVGKGISSVAGFVAMILVIRVLSVAEFAAYSVLIAFVEIINAISGFGLLHVLVRYVPELYAKHYGESLRQLVSGAVALRTTLLMVVAMGALLFSGTLTPWVGLAEQQVAFKVFLLVVVLRSSAFFLTQILESTLHQGISQTAFSVSSLIRVSGVAYLISHGDASLVDVVWVEAASDFSALVILAGGLIRVLGETGTSATDEGEKDRVWVSRHLRHLARFALAGYSQHLAILPYGGNTNRLVGGNMLTVGQLANFGFAQSFYEYLRRYLPAQLLVGLIRPVVVARYCENRDFSVAARLCTRVVQINILLVGSAVVLLAVGGREGLSWISGGKYGAEAATILFALIFVLLLETYRQQLEILVQTVEQYRLLVSSNFVLSASVLLAVAALPSVGAVAFPLANGVGLLIANAWVQARMANLGFRFVHDWPGTLRVVVVVAVSILVGLQVKWFGMNWVGAIAVAASCFALLAYLFCRGVVFAFIAEFTGKGRVALPALEEARYDGSPKIAFGVLSSKKSAPAIDEIARAVFPHPVYVHHDFSKQPEFSPTETNVHILSNPVETAWGNWSLVAATFRLMESALNDRGVTHFQLLSEACLPIQPIREFEEYLSSQRPDAMIDIHPLQTDGALYSHGWRYITTSSFHRRVLKRASIWYWGNAADYKVVSSVNLRLPAVSPNGGLSFRQRIGRWTIDCYLALFRDDLQCLGAREVAIGGQWFGVSRRTAQWLIQANNQLKGLTLHFQKCHIPDESYVHTLLLSAQLDKLPLKVLPSNHAMQWDGCGTGPDELDDAAIPSLRKSGRFFARKFPLERFAHVRRQLLDSIEQHPARLANSQ